MRELTKREKPVYFYRCLKYEVLFWALYKLDKFCLKLNRWCIDASISLMEFKSRIKGEKADGPPIKKYLVTKRKWFHKTLPPAGLKGQIDMNCGKSPPPFDLYKVLDLSALTPPEKGDDTHVN